LTVQHESKAKHVKATWGKRCDILYFVSTEEDESLPSIAIDTPEGMDSLWHKTRLMLSYHIAFKKKIPFLSEEIFI